MFNIALLIPFSEEVAKCGILEFKVFAYAQIGYST